jgi:hypothetical protein
MLESESENETSVIKCWWVGRLANGQQETQGIHIYEKRRATI